MDLFNRRMFSSFLKDEQDWFLASLSGELINTNNKTKEQMVADIVKKNSIKEIVFTCQKGSYAKAQTSSGWKFYQEITINEGVALLDYTPDNFHKANGNYSIGEGMKNGSFVVVVSLEYPNCQIACLKKEDLIDFFENFDRVFAENIRGLNNQIDEFNNMITNRASKAVSDFFEERDEASKAADKL